MPTWSDNHGEVAHMPSLGTANNVPAEYNAITLIHWSIRLLLGVTPILWGDCHCHCNVYDSPFWLPAPTCHTEIDPGVSFWTLKYHHEEREVPSKGGAVKQIKEVRLAEVYSADWFDKRAKSKMKLVK